MQYLDGYLHVRIIYLNFLTPSPPQNTMSHPNTVNVRTCVYVLFIKLLLFWGFFFHFDVSSCVQCCNSVTSHFLSAMISIVIEFCFY